MNKMEKYRMTVFFVLTLLCISCLVVSASNIDDNKLRTNDDHQKPDINVRTTAGDITWTRNGMNARFKASATSYHPSDEGCTLVVKVWNKDNSHDYQLKESEKSEDYLDKVVIIRLDPERYKEGDDGEYEIWIEDASGLESDHVTGEFDILHNDNKILTINQLISKLLESRSPLFERILNLF